MTEKPDNPQAFPLPINDLGDAGYEGMSLRDYFAAAALQGMISGKTQGFSTGQSTFPREAYEYADAMLKERERLAQDKGFI
jgi:hypothetical protein